MDQERPGVVGPVDRPVLKVVVATDAIGRACLVGEREAQEATRTAERVVLRPDVAVDLMCSGRMGPVDVRTLVGADPTTCTDRTVRPHQGTEQRLDLRLLNFGCQGGVGLPNLLEHVNPVAAVVDDDAVLRCHPVPPCSVMRDG